MKNASNKSAAAAVKPDHKAANKTIAALVAAPSVADIGSATVRAVIGAKQHIRNLLSADGASYSLAELCKQSGKSEVNVRTMLSDLRSPKYAGKQGVFMTISTRGTDGVTRYSKAPAAPAPVAK